MEEKFENIPATSTETDKNSAISQDTLEISQETEMKTSLEVAEMEVISQEEAPVIEEEKLAEFTDLLQELLTESDEEKLTQVAETETISPQKTERNEANSGKAEEKMISPQKTERNEANSGKAEEKMISPEDAAKMSQKRKIDAPMEDRKPDKVAKMEETEKKNQTTSQEMDMAISSEEATPAAEKENLEVDNNFDDLIEEFVADPTVESDQKELDDIMACRAEDFFENTISIELSVYQCFRQALESGNSEVLRHVLEPHRSFAGILMIFCLHYHKKEKSKQVVLTILKEYLIENGSIDVVGFVKKYELEESFTALTTLQRGLLLVMCIFVKAGKDNEPVNIVAEAILDAYDAQVWGDEAFETLYRFLRCPDKTLKAVGLTFVTAFAKLCTYRARPDLTAVLYKSRIVETVKEMNEYRLTIQRCAKALEAMPLPSESSS